VGALGHYLEEEGVATTQISLVREHTAAMNPPRALWVPFILGRPFGVPGDAAFQRRVLLAVLRLLEAPSGPVLADYGEDTPQPALDETEGFACPVNFGGAAADDEPAALQREIGELVPWHDMACGRHGRTTAALCGLTPAEAGRFITDFIARPDAPSYRADLSRGLALRLACADLKAYYLESVGVQPGRLAAQQAHEWFWRETIAGAVLLKLRDACMGSDDESVRIFGSSHLVPRAILHARAASKGPHDAAVDGIPRRA